MSPVEIAHDQSARDALAAQVFPKEWARWSKATGKTASKRRQMLRKAAEVEVHLMQPLRAQGAKCGTCRSFEHRTDVGHYCAADSDFHGYTLAKASGLCRLWSPRAVLAQQGEG